MELPPVPNRIMQVDKLRVQIYVDHQQMGQAAGHAVAVAMRRLIESQGQTSVVIAAAPSQNEFLAALASQPRIDWSRVIAFHMDEYVGLPPGAPQGFGWFLRERLFDKVKPGVVHFWDGECQDPVQECCHYQPEFRTLKTG